MIFTMNDEGQRSELASLYTKYKNRLFAVARSNLHNDIDAEDAVQEVFSEIADKPENFFAISKEKRAAYLCSMAKKISVNMLNAKNKIPKISIEELDTEIEDATVTLENALFEKISRDEVAAFINRLPQKQRDALIFCRFYGLSIEETAQKLNISISAVNKHLMLARKAVRAFLEERKKDL